MSDLGGAGLLSWQLDMYRWTDTFRRGREANALANNDAAWIAHFNWAQAEFNKLQQHAAMLANETNKRGADLAEADRTIARQAAEIDRQAAEIERLRQTIAERDLGIAQLQAGIRAIVEDAMQRMEEKREPPFAKD